MVTLLKNLDSEQKSRFIEEFNKICEKYDKTIIKASIMNPVDATALRSCAMENYEREKEELVYSFKN